MAIEKTSRVYVAGHNGLAGSALVRRLRRAGYTNVLCVPRAKLDLADAKAVQDFFEREHPEYVFLAAALVGGIGANLSRPADFIYQNLMIQTSVFHAAYTCKVRRLLFFGSACAYPLRASQPMKEDFLCSGSVEPSSEPFAVAKTAGMRMCGAYNQQYGTQFISVIPASIYGPHDNFDLEGSHVLAALIHKAHVARETGGPMTVWGTGAPLREFIYVDDVVDACLHLMSLDEATFESITNLSWPAVNVGTGQEVTVKELAWLVREVVGFSGGIEFDVRRADGAPRKVLDSSRMVSFGWAPKISLADGIFRTYEWYVSSLRGQ